MPYSSAAKEIVELVSGSQVGPPAGRVVAADE
jgi:hypothetical protein